MFHVVASCYILLNVQVQVEVTVIMDVHFAPAPLLRLGQTSLELFLV